MRYVIVALAAVVVAALVFMGGLWLGRRVEAGGVSNAELHGKVEKEAAVLGRRLDGMDAKLDILLNIATNGAARDFRR